MAEDPLTLHDTTGVLFIGSVVTMTLYGITTLQAYFYYNNYPKDSWVIKSLVAITWVLDTLQICLMCNTVHFYIVTPEKLSEGVWSLYSALAVNVICACIIQFYFAHRIHQLMGNKPWKWITSITIVASIIAHLCTGLVTAGVFIQRKEFAHLKDVSFTTAVPLGITAVVSDILIALGLCVFLESNRSEFKHTNHIINTLMIYAINRCILTTVMTIVELVVFMTVPNPFLTWAVDFLIGKLYANSFLATLNTRASLRQGGYYTSHGSAIGSGDATSHPPSHFVHVHSTRDIIRDDRYPGHVAIELEDTKQSKEEPSIRKHNEAWA